MRLDASWALFAELTPPSSLQGEGGSTPIAVWWPDPKEPWRGGCLTPNGTECPNEENVCLSWLVKKYGKLDRETWREDLKAGFRECFRVLEPGGILVFKWCEDQISTAKVLKLASREPLFGHRRGKTVFLVFMKSTTPN